MKTRISLVSNSSSTSFTVNTKLSDPELYAKLWLEINEYSSYIEPDFEFANSVLVSTGMSDGNECIYKWWVLKKWFDDHNIEYQPQGDGTPDEDQKVCDFVCYVTEKDEEQESDPVRVQQFKDWLFKNQKDSRIDKCAQEIGITREDILNDMENGNPNFTDIYKEIIKEN